MRIQHEYSIRLTRRGRKTSVEGRGEPEKEESMAQQEDEKKEDREKEQHRDERIKETGQATLDENGKLENIHLISIIGEIEGHDNLSNNSKTTKYEHILPSLAAIEDSRDIKGVLVLLNTMGGDVEAGLAIAEQAHGISGSGGQSFHRRSHSGEHRLFFYCAHRNHGDSSGSHERHGDRRSADI